MSNQLDKVLFVARWGIGNGVFAYPSYKFLQDRFEIVDVLTQTQAKEFWQLTAKGEVFEYQDNIIKEDVLKEIENYDLVVCAGTIDPQYYMDQFEGKFGKASIVKVPNSYWTKKYLTEPEYLWSWEVLQLEFGKIEFKRPEYDIETLPEYQGKIVLNVDSALYDTIPRMEKREWPAKKWIELIKKYFMSFPYENMILIGKGNDECSRKIAKYCSVSTIDLVNKTSLKEVLSIIKGAIIFIGIDNGLSCLGSLFDVSQIVLYGPTSERKNELFKPYQKIFTDINCRPCYTQIPECQTECMANISVKQVISTIKNHAL